LKKKFFFILWLAGLALTADKYPPGLRWREINRGPFSIIFPGDRWRQAEAALTGAEIAYDKQAAFWGDRLRGRVRIVLDDSTDEANGFATFFPFQLVGINLHEPAPDSTLACGRDWLDLVLSHELTHIFTLNAAAEPLRVLRRVFGSNPALYPAVQLPPWVSEGLAVYCESAFSGDGRLDHPPFKLMLASARRDNQFPGWSALSGTPAAWPGATAKYLFGAGFMRFLAVNYFADGLRQYVERSTSRLVLFSSSRDFEDTFGKPLEELWEEYRGEPEATPGRATAGSVRAPLLGKGFSNQYPIPLDDKRLAYYHRDYRGRGTVKIMDLESRSGKALFRMDGVNALSDADGGNRIILSAGEYFRALSYFSDLYEFDMKKLSLKRLSRGLRLSQPVQKDNGDGIYCVRRHAGRFFLALFDRRRRTVETLSRGFSGFAQLSLSPGQGLIAAAVKPEGGPWGIGVFSTGGELRCFVSAAGADCRQPRWQNDDTLYFIQAGAEDTRLASFSLAGGIGGLCDDPRLNGLQQFSLDRETRNIYFTYYSGRGMEIARLGLTGLTFSPRQWPVKAGVPETSVAAPEVPSRPYRFWRDLLPRYWSTAMRMGGDEFQAGIASGGQDALGIHRYSVEGYYGISSRRANIQFRYAYDGLFPTLSLSYGDSSDFYGSSHGNGFSERDQALKLVSLWPLRIRKRSQLYGYADLHLERRSDIYDGEIHRYPGSYNGIRLGIDFNSAREYYDSISPADGARFTLQVAIQPAGLGNEAASRSMQADWRHFVSLFRPGVLAWRLVLAKSWAPDGRHDYAMGGRDGETGDVLGDNQPLKLLRGFPAGSQWGDGGYLFNLEYRLPLFKIEKAILPAVSLDRVHVNIFFETGRLWRNHDPLAAAYTIGGEAALRLALGGASSTDLAFGVAHGFGPERWWYFYTRFGRSF
jgi:hypothetical protein